MNSNLPPAEEIKAQNTMSMRQLKLKQLPWQVLDLNINVVRNGESNPITAIVYTIDNDDYRGYLPSKVWYLNDDEDIHFLFYTSSSILAEQKPFGTKNTYIATLAVADTDVIEYESGCRLFIDQVNDGEDTIYVFMFDQDTYDELVIKDTSVPQVDEPVIDLVEMVNNVLGGR